MTPEDVELLRAHVARTGYITVRDEVADVVHELLALPQALVIGIVNYKDWQVPEVPATPADAAAAELAALKAEARRRGLMA